MVEPEATYVGWLPIVTLVVGEISPAFLLGKSDHPKL